MPVLTETSTLHRGQRVQRLLAHPLPFVGRRSSAAPRDCYDVVVVGAGPAGLLLTLLLARFGIGEDRVLCVDSKGGPLQAGHADGLQPRTLEVLKTLGLADEILNEGGMMWEIAFWNSDSGGLVRSSVVPNIGVPARYAQEFLLPQGRVDRILRTDLARYSSRGVVSGRRVTTVTLNALLDHEYPVVVDMEAVQGVGTNVLGSGRRVRAKYVVGADGARSSVRRSMGQQLKGETSDDIWGVVDFVVDTDFPDIRRRCAINSAAGSMMIIPRERIQSGEYLTRLYVQIEGDVAADRDKASTVRSQASFQSLLHRAKRIFAPYRIDQKKGCEIDWCAAYQVGQRMAEDFSLNDEDGMPRIFIAGDACHTHSPKAGQGMNVSLMDTYNLSWKLAHTLQGLSNAQEALLSTYHTERKQVAAELLDIDAELATMFSRKTEQGEDRQQFEDLFRRINGFTTGCGIEYTDSDLVQKDKIRSPVAGTDFLSGILQPGRRLLDVQLLRHADSSPWHIHDDLPSDGRFTIVVFTSNDLLSPDGISAKSLEAIGCLIGKFPETMVRLTVVHSLPECIRGISWSELPPTIKRLAEMRFHSARPGEAPAGHSGVDSSIGLYQLHEARDAYAIYGIDRNAGGLCVVRPDGYVGVIAQLEDIVTVESYLAHWLRQRE